MSEKFTYGGMALDLGTVAVSPFDPRKVVGVVRRPERSTHDGKREVTPPAEEATAVLAEVSMRGVFLPGNLSIGPYDAEVNALARLFAAAPKLLAVCERLAEYETDAHFRHSLHPEDMQALREAIRAALPLAEGEVIHYFDVWGNEEDGWTVNDQRRAGKIQISGEVTKEKVWEALVEMGEARGEFSQADFEEHDSGYDISEKSTGKPVWGIWGLW